MCFNDFNVLKEKESKEACQVRKSKVTVTEVDFEKHVGLPTIHILPAVALCVRGRSVVGSSLPRVRSHLKALRIVDLWDRFHALGLLHQDPACSKAESSVLRSRLDDKELSMDL